MFKIEPRNYIYLNQVFIRQIILDEKEYATIFGYIFDNKTGDIKVWDYVTPINILTDLLLLAGYKGEILIKEISERISDRITPPEIFDVQIILGHTLKINDISVQAYEPKIQDNFGNWILTDNCCYIIE